MVPMGCKLVISLKIIVGSDFPNLAQDAWDLRPASPVQWICREWAKELDFGVWTTVIMVSYSIGWDGLSSSGRIGPRYNSESPFWSLLCVGGIFVPPLSASLYSLFVVVFFLPNGVPRVGTCPIIPSLQLLGVVVRTEKYGRVRRKALNVIMAAFPLNTFVVLFYFSPFPAPWDDRECHHQWQVASSILGYTVPSRALPVAEEGLFLPATEEGFFP